MQIAESDVHHRCRSARASVTSNTTYKEATTYNQKTYSESLGKSRVQLEERLQDAFFKVGAVTFVVSFFAIWLFLEPQLSFLDALYFTMATFTTIGYGDIVPTTIVSRAFIVVFVYASLGPASMVRKRLSFVCYRSMVVVVVILMMLNTPSYVSNHHSRSFGRASRQRRSFLRRRSSRNAYEATAACTQQWAHLARR